MSPRLAGLPRTEVMGRTVAVASTRRSRTLGLSMLDRERCGMGLLIPGCRSVHTFGMRFALDIAFLDAQRRTIALATSVPPRRVLAARGAFSVLELVPGAGRRP